LYVQPNFADEQRSATEDRSVQSLPVNAAATYSSLRRLIKQNLSQNPSYTNNNLKSRIAEDTGKKYSLSIIHKIANELKQEIKIS